jgi:hypothetical protein
MVVPDHPIAGRNLEGQLVSIDGAPPREIQGDPRLRLEIAAKEIAMTLLKTHHGSTRHLIIVGAALAAGLALLAFERFGSSPGQDADLPLAPQSAVVLLGAGGTQRPAPSKADASVAVAPRRIIGPLLTDGEPPEQLKQEDARR